MKKLLCSLLLLLSFNTSSADIRIFNGTSDDIIVDVLSEHGQQRDVLIPGRSFSELLGAKRIPANTKEVVVYKDKSGKEISRDDYWSGAAFIFAYHSPTSFRKDQLYEFVKSENRSDLIHFINNTGSRLETKYETPDFQLQESVLHGPDPNAAAGVWSRNISLYGFVHAGEENASREVTLTAPVFDQPQKIKFTAGNVYLLEAQDGKCKVTQVYP